MNLEHGVNDAGSHHATLHRPLTQCLGFICDPPSPAASCAASHIVMLDSVEHACTHAAFSRVAAVLNYNQAEADCTATCRYVGDLCRGVSAACCMFKGLPSASAFMTASLMVAPSLVSKHGPRTGQKFGLMNR